MDSVFIVWKVEREGDDWRVRRWFTYRTRESAEKSAQMLSERDGRFGFVEEEFLDG